MESESSLPCLQVPPDHIAWSCCTLKTVSNSFLESVSSLQLWRQLLCTKEQNPQSYNLKVSNLNTWTSREKVTLRIPLLLIYWAQLTVILEVMLHRGLKWTDKSWLVKYQYTTIQKSPYIAINCIDIHVRHWLDRQFPGHCINRRCPMEWRQTIWFFTCSGSLRSWCSRWKYKIWII